MDKENSNIVRALFRLILGVVFFVPFHDALAQTNLKGSEVKGGLVSSEKGNNIFDPSPIQNRIKIKKEQPEQEETQETEQEQVSDTQTSGTSDLGPVRINAEEIAERAGGDRSLMNALEESRKLKERLGIVGGQQKSDPKNQIEGIKNSLEKQKKLEEQQKYQF